MQAVVQGEIGSNSMSGLQNVQDLGVAKHADQLLNCQVVCQLLKGFRLVL